VSAATTQKPVPLKSVLAPFLTLAAKTPNKPTYQQIQANLINPLLAALSPPESGPPLPESSNTSKGRGDFSNLLANSCLFSSDEPLDSSRLRKSLLEYIFEVASREDTKDSNRRKLYAICNANLDEDYDS
jgi:ribosomal RNA-processing protein 1